MEQAAVKDNVDTLLAEGDRLYVSEALADAVKAYESAVTINSESAEAQFKLGRGYASLTLSDKAEKCYRRALAIQPAHAEAANNLGVIAFDRREFAEAEQLYRRALAERLDYFEAHLNLGQVLVETERLIEASYHFGRACELAPESAFAAELLGKVSLLSGMISKAIHSLERAIAIDGQAANPWALLGVCRQRLGSYAEAEKAYRKSLKCSSTHNYAWHCFLLMTNYAYREKDEAFALHRAFGEAMGGDNSLLPFNNRPDPSRRLRIGFVSGDLRFHSVSYFIGSVLPEVSRNDFELWAYFNYSKSDSRTAEMQRSFYAWRDIWGRSDVEVAKQIREDGIDILFDLSGHTSHNRLAVFAQKPAPVQVSWVGYPNTSGLTQIDYRLTDALADPQGDSDEFYTEHLWRLPHGFLCYWPPTWAPRVAESPSRSLGYVTFGSFNNRQKIGVECVVLWAKLLQAVPDSRLLIKSVFGVDEQTSRDALVNQFVSLGISAERIRIESAKASQEEHLAMYSEIDIALDTYPYHGVTTTCEALWMGVPVVSRQGDRHVSRVGASILTNASLGDLVADSDEQFVEIASQLAADIDSLSVIRGALREVVKASRLTNGSAMANDISSAMRQMWEIYCTNVKTQTGENEAPGLDDGGRVNGDGIMRLVIGGNEPRDGWQYFSSESGDGIAFDGDLCDLGRFGTDTYSEVYCAHIVQRLAQADLQAYLKDLHRILRPGGKLYLAVPDLDALAWMFSSPLYAKTDKFQLMRLMFGRQDDQFDFNHIGLNADFLSDYLRSAGFARVEHVESFGLFEDVSTLQVNGTLVSLNLLAIK